MYIFSKVIYMYNINVDNRWNRTLYGLHLNSVYIKIDWNGNFMGLLHHSLYASAYLGIFWAWIFNEMRIWFILFI